MRCAFLKCGIFLRLGILATSQGNLLRSTSFEGMLYIYDDESPATRSIIPDELCLDKATVPINKADEDDNHMDDVDFSVFAPSSCDSRAVEKKEQIDGDALRRLADTTKPTITSVEPASGAVVGNIFEVRAIVTDNVGLKNVLVKLYDFASKSTRQLSLFSTGGDLWTRKVHMPRPGSAQMTLIAYDTAGNSASTTPVKILSDFVSTAQWNDRNAPIARAVGWIIFEILDWDTNVWTTRSCTGTLVQTPSDPPDRSIVMTVDNCVYEMINDKFARNALFIPQYDDGGSDMPDRDCKNDALGCLPLDFAITSLGSLSFYVSKSTKTMVKNLTIGAKGQIVPLTVNFGPVKNQSKMYAFGYAGTNSSKLMYTSDILQIQNSSYGSFYRYSFAKDFIWGDQGGPWIADDPSKGVVDVFAVTDTWNYEPFGYVEMFAAPCNSEKVACAYDAAVSINLSAIKTQGMVVQCFE